MRQPPRYTLLAVGAALLLTGLYLADGAVGDWVGRWLTCSRAGVEQGQLWRLLSGPLIHASAGHAARDLVTLLVLGVLWERALGRRYLLLLLLGTAIPAAASLAGDPGLTRYFGLSSTVYSVLAGGLAHEWRRVHVTDRRRALLVLLVTLCVVAKIVIEGVTGQLILPAGHPATARPIPLAHLAGALCGVLVMIQAVLASPPPKSA